MKTIRSILLVIIGAFSIFVGIDIRGRNTGDVETFKEYGGDAYTGIQNTEARTGSNVRFQSEIIKEGMSDVFIICGMIIIVFAFPVSFVKTKPHS